MHYRLKAEDIGAPARLGPSAWQRSRLPPDLGACHTDSLVFDDGLAVAYAHYQPTHDLLDARTLEREPSLTFTIALEGRSSTVGADGQRFDFMAGHSTVAAFASISGERRFPANQSIRQLRLIADHALLHRYGLDGLLDGVHGNPSARLLHTGQHGAAIRALANSLLHLRDQDGSLLDLHIAALSLLSAQSRPCLPPRTPPARLSSRDQERLLRAREILACQFDRPLTVGYLCAAVGTNEFKLKQGFRDMFGTSPHRMLTDIRMRKAWELLETGLHVSTVAYQIGYQHPSSFSTAFERHYGRTPKSLRPAGVMPARKKNPAP
ncbi:helix-turn-helix transcriptional regulator [Achromobacter sp. Marseille-Q0513]|uniref:helix-turn-helix transcriptional regulator n=1 Tax=Achromobacter sp. Marseille-Q0513 TaxID=2829161 RepID=UPI001BA388A1|nr:AraC family transcriptional regulator [Achromobacter sp. Marseille-Q0513]MBR8652066.1 helix-turn-helix transcriptional regulator [Achromobacter sp. Marseille-Q0513]